MCRSLTKNSRCNKGSLRHTGRRLETCVDIYWELRVMVNTSVSEAEVIGSSPVFPTVFRIGGRLRKQSFHLSIRPLEK